MLVITKAVLRVGTKWRVFKPQQELDFQGNVSQNLKKFRSEFEVFMCAAGRERG